MKCYLVRHGQTSWNETKRFQGWSDVELSNIGINQAQKLSSYFKEIQYGHLYSSDLLRALKTGHLIHAKHDCPMTITKGLREIDVGEWEGLTKEEILALYQDDKEMSMDDLWSLPRKKGESIEDLFNRSVQTFQEILAKTNEKDIVIVTHGGVIRAIVCYILKCKLGEANYGNFDNGSVTILEIDKQKNIKILKQNVSDHLKQ